MGSGRQQSGGWRCLGVRATACALALALGGPKRVATPGPTRALPPAPAGLATVRAASAPSALDQGLPQVQAALERQTIPAALRVESPDRLRIEVSDAGAAHPLTVDPWINGVADARLESDEASAFVGMGVASAGDVGGDGYACNAGQTLDGAGRSVGLDRATNKVRS